MTYFSKSRSRSASKHTKQKSESTEILAIVSVVCVQLWDLEIVWSSILEFIEHRIDGVPLHLDSQQVVGECLMCLVHILFLHIWHIIYSEEIVKVDACTRKLGMISMI